MTLAARSTTTRVVAEFLAIVVGVLVALGVDAWAQRRSEDARASAYLTRLEEELVANQAVIDDVLTSSLDGADSALARLKRFRAGTYQPPDAAEFVQALLRARVPGLPGTLSQSTWDDLQSTGSIRLIRDPTVRTQLQLHYAGIERRRSILATEYTHYPRALSEVLPGEAQRFSGLGTDPDPAAVLESLRSLRSAPDLDRHINSRLGYLTLQRGFTLQTRASLEELLEVIRTARLEER